MNSEKKVIHGTGRRKCSVARVYITNGTGQFRVNKRTLEDFFQRYPDQEMSKHPLSLLDGEMASFDIKANVRGGGTSGQAGAVRLGLARAILNLYPHMRSSFKTQGWLTRDSRMVERKKPGRVKARKVQQFKKR